MENKKEEYTYYCNSCGKAWETTEDLDKCKYCGSSAIVRIKF